MLVLLAHLALADDSPELTTCLAGATTDLAMRACASAEFDRQDGRLNDVYARERAAEDDDGKALLKKAELAWIAWRDADCAWHADENRGGTLALLNEISCRADLTRQRADELQARLDAPR
jgi:uncharacterized protein YecT (DUF1311 family)